MGKSPNGNLKLNVFKKNLYIVHPDRCKLAEINFTRVEENSGAIKHKKNLRISFQEREEIIEEKLYENFKNQFNESQMRPNKTILRSILTNRL